MADQTNDSHIVVEIPVDEEHQQKLSLSISSAIQQHPLTEISRSPGHLLLLKLWQREEDLYGRRMARKETRMDWVRREIFQLCCFFFLFHGLFLTVLFTSLNSPEEGRSCRKWWLPALVSLSSSAVLMFLVQVKLFRYWKVSEQLGRERSENRAVTRCIQELRMKGASFDLSKEPARSGKKMKSSSVEIKWRPISWCSQYLITICLVCFSGLVVPACRLIILCGI